MSAGDASAEQTPTLSEQVADQLGGVRGMIEASVPVLAFVVANLIWSLMPALIISVVVAVAIAGYRLRRRQSARYAGNGLVGVIVGAIIAAKTGRAQDFYLAGILYTVVYGIALAASIAARRPLVGWIWSLIVDRGANRWRLDPGLRRVFGWLTAVWASIYLGKGVLSLWIWHAGSLSDDQKTNILGILRLALGYPPYALLLALTIWAVRRHQQRVALAG